MNIFSNIGITELIFILLLALLVVGPERLPELARKLGKMLRDLRQAYDNLTRDLGPELMSLQQTTQELRRSVESVRSIPQDMVQSVIKAADLDETVQELKEVQGDIGQVKQTLSEARQAVQDPLKTAIHTVQEAGPVPSATPPREEAQNSDISPTEQVDE
mgnify:CR=1 FL=1